MRVILLAFAAVLLTGAAMSAYEVPDAITLTRLSQNPPASQWVGDVKFPHGEHAVREGCRTCHHKESGKTLGGFVPCRECHSDPDQEDETGFYQAWHNDTRQSCVGCHRMERLKGSKKPPFDCASGCHKIADTRNGQGGNNE